MNHHIGTREECDAMRAADDARAGYPAIRGQQTDGGFHRRLATVATTTDPETGEVRRGGPGVVMHTRGLRRHPDRDEWAYEVPPQAEGESQADYIARLRVLYPPGLAIAAANVGELPTDWKGE